MARAGACLYCALKEESLLMVLVEAEMVESGFGGVSSAGRLRMCSYGAAALYECAEQAGARISLIRATTARDRVNECEGGAAEVGGSEWSRRLWCGELW